MSFAPSVFRLLIAVVVLLSATLFLNFGRDPGRSDAVLGMSAYAKPKTKLKCTTVDGQRKCEKVSKKKKKKKPADPTSPESSDSIESDY